MYLSIRAFIFMYLSFNPSKKEDKNGYYKNENTKSLFHV